MRFVVVVGSIESGFTLRGPYTDEELGQLADPQGSLEEYFKTFGPTSIVVVQELLNDTKSNGDLILVKGNLGSGYRFHGPFSDLRTLHSYRGDTGHFDWLVARIDRSLL